MQTFSKSRKKNSALPTQTRQRTSLLGWILRTIFHPMNFLIKIIILNRNLYDSVVENGALHFLLVFADYVLELSGEVLFSVARFEDLRLVGHFDMAALQLGEFHFVNSLDVPFFKIHTRACTGEGKCLRNSKAMIKTLAEENLDDIIISNALLFESRCRK